MTEPLKFSAKPKLRKPTVIVGWEADAAHLGSNVTGDLIKNLKAKSFCEIEPADFFPLNGVSIENDVVQFPQSTFYACPEHDLIIFHSAIPRYEWYKFFNLIIDVALEYHAKEMYSVGAMVTLAVHTIPRDAWATFNTIQIKKALSSFKLSREIDFDTSSGGRPTLNSFLLWTAQRRNLAGANFWVPVPFYLITAYDAEADKKVLTFSDNRLKLNFDFSDVDTRIKKQNEKLERLRQSSTEIEGYFNKLENNIRLSDEERDNMVRTVEEYLKRKGG